MNILLITTDQQRFDHLGIEGVKGINTPHLDRMAREGVHFHRAYTASPLCTPARLSLLTGQYPSSHGGYSIGVTPDPFPRRTLPAILGENGYGTALIGKAHFVSRSQEAAQIAGLAEPPQREFWRDHRGSYAGFQIFEGSGHHTINGIPEFHYRAWLEEKGVPYQEWFPDLAGTHDHAATGSWNIPPEYHDSTWITERVTHAIESAASGGRPWFCWASYADPHEPFVCPEPWYSNVRMAEVEPFPGYRPGEFDAKPAFYREAYESRAHSGPWPEKYRHEPGLEVPCAYSRPDLEGREAEALRATLGMVAMLDHQVGRLLQVLERTGQSENTLVLFTSDHGELHGHHGLWHKGLFAFEDGQRIPLLAWGPGCVKAQGTTHALANLVDLPRTILSVAGVQPPQGMQGADLQPILAGDKPSVQDETVIEMQATKRIYQQTLVTDRHKLVVYRDSDDGELYDLEADPDQYENLWNQASSAPLKSALLLRFAQANMRREGHVHDRVAFA